MKFRSILILLVLALGLAVIAACVPAPTPQVVEKVVTVEVEKEVIKEVEKEVVVTVEVQVPAEAAAVVEMDGAGKKIAAVFPGPVNDAGWTTSAYLGLVHLRDNYGFDIAYSERVAVADAAQVMREYAEAGYDIVLAHGYEFADPIYQVAQEYPDVNFIQNNGSADDLANLYTITFSAGEGGYFMGRLACQISESGKIAAITGTEFPIWSHHLKMMRQACADIGKGDAEIIESYVGSWDDPAKAKELAKAAIEQGADVLILQADAGDTGTVEAAREAAEAGKYIRVISWVRDKNYLAPDIILGGWKEEVGKNMEWTVRRIMSGEPGGHFALGLVDGSVALEPFYGLVPAEIEQDIVKTLHDYLKDPASLPNLEVRTDL